MPMAFIAPLLLSFVLVIREATVGPKKDSRRVYTSSPVAAATTILSCLCIAHRFHSES